MQLSDIIRDAFLCSEQWLVQKFTTDQSAESVSRVPSNKWDIYDNPSYPLSKAQEPLWKTELKDSKNQRSVGSIAKQSLLNMTEPPYSLTHGRYSCLHRILSISSQLEFYHEERSSWAPTPIQGTMNRWCLLDEGKSVFFMGVVSGSLNMFNWIAIHKLK